MGLEFESDALAKFFDPNIDQSKATKVLNSLVSNSIDFHIEMHRKIYPDLIEN